MLRGEYVKADINNNYATHVGNKVLLNRQTLSQASNDKKNNQILETLNQPQQADTKQEFASAEK